MTAPADDRRPVRIQRRRTKGWRAPAGAVYVGRGTRWGNPCRIGLDADNHGHATTLYQQWLTANDVTIYNPYINDDRRAWIIAHVTELRGLDLMCWCPLPEPGQPDHCHAAVLLRLANECGARHHDHTQTVCTEPFGHYRPGVDPHAGPLVVNGKEIGRASWDQPIHASAVGEPL